ncbi:hypothetical protein [Lysinibacillus capsici]|uniref:hypothetical protein n=1 Tax=Lysinibacillus capsici TaxID=2115968 RepID=UPI0034E51B39
MNNDIYVVLTKFIKSDSVESKVMSVYFKNYLDAETVLHLWDYVKCEDDVYRTTDDEGNQYESEIIRLLST